MNIPNEAVETNIRRAQAKELRDAERLIAPDAWEYDEQFAHFFEGRRWAAQYLRIRADQLDPEKGTK